MSHDYACGEKRRSVETIRFSKVGEGVATLELELEAP